MLLHFAAVWLLETKKPQINNKKLPAPSYRQQADKTLTIWWRLTQVTAALSTQTEEQQTLSLINDCYCNYLSWLRLFLFLKESSFTFTKLKNKTMGKELQESHKVDIHPWSRSIHRLWLCVNWIAIIKPSYSHQEEVRVCCGGSSTMWKITAHLSTISLADEWQRQEKLLLSHLCDALWIRSVSAGHTKKLKNERTAAWRIEGFRWWKLSPGNMWMSLWAPIIYSNTFSASYSIFHYANPQKRFQKGFSSNVGVRTDFWFQSKNLLICKQRVLEWKFCNTSPMIAD